MKEKMAIVAAAKYAMNDEERSVAKKAWLDGYEAGFLRAVQLQSSLAEYIQQQNPFDLVVHGEPLLKKFLEQSK